MVLAEQVTVAGISALAVLATGCASSPHRDDVSTAARAFVEKVEVGDGAGACEMLTDQARSAVTGATDASCADAVTNLEERGGTVGRVQVWGDAAQVQVPGDVLFLRRVSGTWRVSAAGCTPQPEGPYDCKVEG